MTIVSEAGRYRMLQRIGSGGMAEVLEAIAVGEHGFERRVAIKRLLPGSDAPHERMFIDEARIASQLHHANIVAVLDYGVVDGRPFQVLEHVDGIDVQGLLARSGDRLPVELALHICAMVGHALTYAHAACASDGTPLGIVHRDVTPTNVLVAWSGDVKLTDFGIAFAHDRVEKTLDGSTKGTPLYMAPEQMLAGDIDRRTDLFSLGCVLHTMVTGRSPLSHEEQLLRLAAGGELELDPELPDDVRAIIARATRYLRRDRYRDAGELVAAIAQVLAARGAADPHSALREWLRTLHGEPPPARGRLDALLGVDLVRATSDAHRFESVVAATRPDRPGLVAPPVPPTRRRGKPKRWPYAAGAGAIAVITVILLVAKTGSSQPAELSALTPHTPAEDAIERWTSKHKPAARALDEWVHANPVAAAALFAWDDQHPTAAVDLVAWASGDSAATLDAFLQVHPALRGLGYHAELEAFVAWIRRYPQAAQSLVRHPRGLAWVGRQLH
jgi:Protein kinase domain